LATDARVHCAVLKQRPATHHPTPKGECTGAGNRRTDSDEPVPSDTQQRARHDRPSLTFHAEAVLVKNNLSCRIVNVPPMSNHRRTSAGVMALDSLRNLDAP